MKKLKILLYIIGVGQIVLGIMALFFPQFFFETVMNLSEINTDTGYPLGMYAGRLLVFGIGMFITATDPQKYLILIKGIILVQIIDLIVGIFYVSTGSSRYICSCTSLIGCYNFHCNITIMKT